MNVEYKRGGQGSSTDNSSDFKGISNLKYNNNNNNNNHANVEEQEDNGDDMETAGGDGLYKFDHQLDALMISMDKEPMEGFDPNQHWTSCWGRFLYELNPCQNWYLVQDPPFTNRTLDIAASFAPRGLLPMMSKSTSICTVVAILVWSMITEDHRAFFFAYLSTWNLVFSLIYFYCSLHNSFHGVMQPFSRTSGFVRLCWFFFVVAAHAGVMEAILFWATEYEKNYTPNSSNYSSKVDFRIIMLHGGITAGVILDGLTVNVIPLRWMHWWGCCLPVSIAYSGWTLIHAFFLVTGNPNQSNRNTIYSVIDWRFHLKDTLIYVLLAIFVISPVIFAVLWLLSLYKWLTCCCCYRERRHYLENAQNQAKYNVLDNEQQQRHDMQNADVVQDPESTTFLGEDNSNAMASESPTETGYDSSVGDYSHRGAKEQ